MFFLLVFLYGYLSRCSCSLVFVLLLVGDKGNVGWRLKPSSRVQGFVKYRLQTRVLSNLFFAFASFSYTLASFVESFKVVFIRKIVAYWPIVIFLTEHSLSSCIGTSTSILILALFIWFFIVLLFTFGIYACLHLSIIYYLHT